MWESVDLLIASFMFILRVLVDVGVSYPDDKRRIDNAKPEIIIWATSVSDVKWQCDGQSTIGTTTLDSNPKEWYVYLHTKSKSSCWSSKNKNSGRLEWAAPGKF